MSWLAIDNLLKNDPGFASAIGTWQDSAGNTHIRVFPNSSPQSVSTPYGVSHVIDNNPTNSKGNVSSKDFKRLQLDFYGDYYDIVEELFEKARAALDGFKGTSQGVRLEINFLGENEGFEGDGELDRKSADFLIRQYR